MKKTIISFLTLAGLLSSAELNAQEQLKLSLDAGYTYSVLDTDVSNLIDAKYNGKYGFGINLNLEYMIWKSVFATSGISYLQKNYEYERTGSHTGWYTDYHNDYLSFPLMLGFYALNNPHGETGLWLKFAGGMYMDYWLKMKRDGRYPVFNELQPDGTFLYTNVTEKYDFKKNENQLARFGYGLQGQAQLGYAFKKFDVYAAYNYQYGLSDINNTNVIKNQKASTRNYMLSVGAALKFD